MLHIVTGAPCSGKTTFVKNHAQKGNVVIDADALSYAFGNDDFYKANGDILKVTLDAREKAIETALKLNTDVWLIDSKLTNEKIQKYKDLNAEIIELETTMDECIERARKDNRPPGTEDVIKEWFSTLKGGKEMSEEFKPIESQEALDAVLRDRLNRQNEKHAREVEELKNQYKDYDSLISSKTSFEAQIAELTTQLSTANEKLAGYDSQIAERDAKIKQYEMDSVKTRVANSFGLSTDAIEFLRGETEEEITASAEKLSKIAPKQIAPLAASAPVAADSEKAAFKSMLTNLQN